MKKIIYVLFFCFIILFIYRLGQRPRQIYRYVDIQMPTDGADGAEAMGLSGGADGADHNKK